MYNETLGFKINEIEAKYYADGEDAYDMRNTFKNNPKAPQVERPTIPFPKKKEVVKEAKEEKEEGQRLSK